MKTSKEDTESSFFDEDPVRKQNKSIFDVFFFFFFFFSTGVVHYARAIEQFSSEQIYTVTSVPMQSVVLPCKAVLPHQDPERVRIVREDYR